MQKTFAQFLQENNIDEADPQVVMLKRCWNQAIETASEFFGEMESTDYEIRGYFQVP